MIEKILNKLNIKESNYETYFNKFAKVSNVDNNKHQHSKLIVVTSINPTPAGEGKTTLLIGLLDALNHCGYKAIGALREPSLGPVFGMKGTATGGGQTRLENEDEINLNFTGDFHAITSANNLITTIIENEIYFNSNLQIDENKILWKRCIDLNDRGLREINIKLNNGESYSTGFNITAASDLMALFCLVNNIDEFKEKLNNTLVAFDIKNNPIKIKDLELVDAIVQILHRALKPNLAYTSRLNPVLIHGGPFANIAHGCNSLIATKTGLQLSDYVITECGFGSDLGFEKLMNIKMQQSGLYPNLVIICATIKALKYHGSTNKNNIDQITFGFNNVIAHVQHVKSYNIEPLVILNIHEHDNQNEINLFHELCANNKIKSSQSDMYFNGMQNVQPLIKSVIENIKDNKPKFLYDVNKDSLNTKIKNICKFAYHIENIEIDEIVMKVLKYNDLQDYFICIAKTQYSLTSDPTILNYCQDGKILINKVEINHAAKLVIPICGNIWKMPGLPKEPLAKNFNKN